MKGLGERIRTLRISRRLTLTQISTKTGIDQATLSRIENGIMTGTLASHMKIADALGVTLPDLYEVALARRNEAGDKAVKNRMESFFSPSGAVAELLTGGILQKKMLPVLLKLKPKGSTSTEQLPPGSERFLYILSGGIELTVEKEKRFFKAGESTYFNAALPHVMRNAASSESKLISVVTPASP